jgi:SET domain-containing protein
VYVANSNIGRGLFAARDLSPGEVALRFTGPVISLAEALAKGEEQANPLQVGPFEYIDLEPPGVFINHSCHPNAGIRDDVVLVALRSIAKGEEVRFDYSTSMWEDCWTLGCRCGEANCRGMVGDFPSLRARLQRRYLSLGVVQRFIVSRLRREAGPACRRMCEVRKPQPSQV